MATPSRAMPTIARRCPTWTVPSGVPPEHHAVQADRADEERGGDDRRGHGEQVDGLLEIVQVGESGLERQGEQEPGEELNTGLGHPEFLQQVSSVAVQLLERGLVAFVRLGICQVK
jgi:hypothetical protein